MSDNEELSQQPLTRKRGQAKAAISRFKNFLSKFDVFTGDVDELELRLDKLHVNELEWRDCHSKINVECEAEDINDENEKLIDFEELMIEVMSKARKYIKQMNKEESQGELGSSQSQQPIVYRYSSNMGPLKIAPFYGKREDWLRYKEMFCAIMAKEQPPPDNIEKLHRLKQTCTGKALRVVEGLSYTELSFDIAWALLIKKYEDIYTLVSLQSQHLLQLEEVVQDDGESLSELIDSVSSALAALNSLKVDTSSWDVMIITIVVSKLDDTTRQLWQTDLVHNQLPTWEQLLDFLSQRARVLISSSTLNKVKNQSPPPSSRKVEHHWKSKMSRAMAVTGSTNCIKCNLNHKLELCPTFKRLSTSQKYDLLKRSNSCFTCLDQGHMSRECPSTIKCGSCRGPHNTLLHGNITPSATTSDEETSCGEQGSREEGKSSTVCHQRSSASNVTVLLATAIVFIKDEHGNQHRCRALLDIGSMEHFISEDLVQRLGLKKRSQCRPIEGINCTTSQSKATVLTVIESTTEPVKKKLLFSVVPKVTGELPGAPVDIKSWRIPSGIKLADPRFNQPQQVDLLLGGQVFCELLKIGKITLAKGQPYLLNTKLGWVVSGQSVTKRESKDPTQAMATFCGFTITKAQNKQRGQPFRLNKVIIKTEKAENKANTKRIQQSNKNSGKDKPQHTTVRSGLTEKSLEWRSKVKKIHEHPEISGFKLRYRESCTKKAERQDQLRFRGKPDSRYQSKVSDSKRVETKTVLVENRCQDTDRSIQWRAHVMEFDQGRSNHQEAERFCSNLQRGRMISREYTYRFFPLIFSL